VFKDKLDSKEGPALEITEPAEELSDNNQQADPDSQGFENDLRVILPEDDLLNKGNHSDENRLPNKSRKSYYQRTSEIDSPTERALVIWIIAGISGLFLIIGIVVLWNLLAPSLGSHNTVTKEIAPIATLYSDFETMDLDPFLIPAQRDEETIFFKLQVKLIVPDIKTKRAIEKKEAWIRDTIYRELKGIKIKSDINENFLMKYRQPIIRCLNHEFAPLRVEDVHLKGYSMN
jgi:flagellar basal body-associated protein FliL